MMGFIQVTSANKLCLVNVDHIVSVAPLEKTDGCDILLSTGSILRTKELYDDVMNWMIEVSPRP